MPITDTEALTRVIDHREIFHDEMLALMRRIMSGEMSPVMIAALSIGLRVKKETIGEIAAAAQVMREFATPVAVADSTHLVDIVRHRRRRLAHLQHLDRLDVRRRRGRRRASAKHGGRSVSSSSGSADVLEALGAHIALTPAQVGDMPGRDGHRLHVRAQPPRLDEARRAGAQGAGRAHHLQHPGAADQSGRRAEPADGRVPPRPGRHPGARAAAPGQPST